MIFGAGQMYMGFMKQGISIKTATVVVIFTGSWLNIGPIMFALPVLWFYSFFDSINKMSMPDEKFQELEDNYLFLQKTDNVQIKKVFMKYDNIIAAVLIIVGVSILGDNFLDYIANLLFQMGYPQIYDLLMRLSWNTPRLLFAIVIIAIGIKMIRGKKRELELEVLQISKKESSDENA
jgi:hypothetical protein